MYLAGALDAPPPPKLCQHWPQQQSQLERRFFVVNRLHRDYFQWSVLCKHTVYSLFLAAVVDKTISPLVPFCNHSRAFDCFNWTSSANGDCRVPRFSWLVLKIEIVNLLLTLDNSCANVITTNSTYSQFWSFSLHHMIFKTKFDQVKAQDSKIFYNYMTWSGMIKS